jgi:hypothetical protein
MGGPELSHRGCLLLDGPPCRSLPGGFHRDFSHEASPDDPGHAIFALNIEDFGSAVPHSVELEAKFHAVPLPENREDKLHTRRFDFREDQQGDRLHGGGSYLEESYK